MLILTIVLLSFLTPLTVANTHGLVSIIMPAYNAEKTIEQSILSVLNQSYTDFELIIVDDGSTDSTVSKAKSFFDHRIRLISQSNQGVSVARNTGLFHSSGEFIAFLDSDDCWMSNKLSVQIACISANDEIDFVFSSFKILTARGIYNGPVHANRFASLNDLSSRILVGDFIGTLTVLLRKSTLDKHGPLYFDPSLSGTEDWDLWIRVLQTAKPLYIHNELAFYRQSLDSLSGNFLVHHHQELKVLLKHEPLFDRYSPYLRSSAYILWRLKALRYWLFSFDISNLLKEIKALFAGNSLRSIIVSIPLLFPPSYFVHIARRFIFQFQISLRAIPEFVESPLPYAR